MSHMTPLEHRIAVNDLERAFAATTLRRGTRSNRWFSTTRTRLVALRLIAFRCGSRLASAADTSNNPVGAEAGPPAA